MWWKWKKKEKKTEEVNRRDGSTQADRDEEGFI